MGSWGGRKGGWEEKHRREERRGEKWSIVEDEKMGRQEGGWEEKKRMRGDKRRRVEL